MGHKVLVGAVLAGAATMACAQEVGCISPGTPRAACEGALKYLDKAGFTKRFPDHAIMVSATSFRAKYAPIGVSTGTLYIMKLVREGKSIGLRPVWTFSTARDTDNLSDGFDEKTSAELTGMNLGGDVNKALKNGDFDLK